MGNKIASLEKLIEIELNTPDIRILRNWEEIDEFLYEGMEGWDRISIRTDNKKGREKFKAWGLPFFPNKTREETKEILSLQLYPLIWTEIDVIVAKGINPEEALLSGKYMRDGEDIVEFVLGGSTVRDVDQGIPRKWYPLRELAPMIPGVPLSLARLPEIVQYIIAKHFQAPFIVEFSIYPYELGRLNDQLIFWEVIEEKRPSDSIL